MKRENLAIYFSSLQQSQPLIAPSSASKIGLIVKNGKSVPTWATPYGETVIDWSEIINPSLTDPTYCGAYTYVKGWNPIKEEWE